MQGVAGRERQARSWWEPPGSGTLAPRPCAPLTRGGPLTYPCSHLSIHPPIHPPPHQSMPVAPPPPPPRPPPPPLHLQVSIHLDAAGRPLHQVQLACTAEA